MAEASKSVQMPVSRDKLWKVIKDYERYPEFVDGVHTAKVLSRNGGTTRVQYGIELLSKEITYTLDHFDEGDEKMHWEFVESNILKANSGEWILKSTGPNTTDVTYTLALDFKIYVPGMILNGLVKSTLPKMLESFEKRASNG
jgi:coenzyme Q-binding protein COQ10